MNDTRRTILLVEDNADDEALTLRALSRHGVVNDVVVARDGVEALDYLFATGAWAGRDTRQLPLLVLLDLKLPRIDGLEVLRRLRADARTATLPVVVLTSSNEPTDIAGSYAEFANSYIRKPVNFTDFVDVVGKLGLYWLILNVSPSGDGES